MPRNANEQYYSLGTVADFGAAVAFSEVVAVPENLVVTALVVHHEDAADTTNATSWELFVNGSDSGVAFGGDKDAAAGEGFVFGADGRFEAKAGDLLSVIPDGAETGTTPVAYATLILTR